jgi:hypothetical protein
MKLRIMCALSTRQLHGNGCEMAFDKSSSIFFRLDSRTQAALA